MKKSMVVLSALAVLSTAGSAAALDVDVERILIVPGLTSVPGVATDILGTAVLTPLGTSGRYCQYLMEWVNPFNPNDAELCLLRERKTAFSPSCIYNRQFDHTTTVSGGLGSPHCTTCVGFDNLGIADDVTLLLGEDPGGMSGIAIYEGAIPLVLPVDIQPF
jgi:hypothetical protein